MTMLIVSLGFSLLLTGCSRDDQGKVDAAANGQVVELEGQQDQYGWFPHMRLTFNGDILTTLMIMALRNLMMKNTIQQ